MKASAIKPYDQCQVKEGLVWSLQHLRRGFSFNSMLTSNRCELKPSETEGILSDLVSFVKSI